MKIQFLGQGYESTSKDAIGKHLLRLLADKAYDSFTAISAFVSEAGIQGLAANLTALGAHLSRTSVITGVDQKGTSKEALEALLAMGVDAFVFYQPAVSIFHPKIYLFEGPAKSTMLLGSSNLTAQGLFTNVESSLMVEVGQGEANGPIEQMKAYYKGLFDRTDPNLQSLSQMVIDDLVNAGVVPTEAKRKARHAKQSVGSGTGVGHLFPKRSSSSIPAGFRQPKTSSTRQSVSKPASGSSVSSGTSSQVSTFLWESGPLSERDLNIPKGRNTNATGSMLFKKGKSKGIDQRHYFRDVIFKALNWKPDSRRQLAHLERAEAKFDIHIGGQQMGAYVLRLSHNTDTTSRTYQQNNSMTSLHWDQAKNTIADPNLIGQTVKLHSVPGKHDHFVLDFS